ncbi:MAG: type II secretion system protein GspE [Deltaproteobacteria bacterium]|nr:type II secretion system protein GspE [Deltaproteobacteria bacterium]NIS78610.1 type II secretion system protein GspE [Deltaproteobacteria bacterium]
MGSKIKIKKKLGELLIESGMISENDLTEVLAEQKTKRKKVGEILVESGFCTEIEIATALSSQLGMQFIDLKNTAVEPVAIDIIPEKVARKHLIIPTNIDGKDLHVAMADPLSFEAFEDVRFASGFTIQPFVATKSDIIWAIDHHYNLGASLDTLVKDISADKVVEVLHESKEEKRDTEDLRKKSEAAPVIRMVNLIISEAVEIGASDIHIEPDRGNLVIRNRVDGLLRQSIELPKWVQGAVISRIKIMANMDIAEKRLPQDGRIGVRVGGSMLDLRISSLPTHYGEKVVVRILDPANAIISVDALGMEGKNLDKFISLISKPQGIILVTGPTGSGKTTTLYSALTNIKSIEKNITTIEDPVEYELEGISQVAVNEKVGLSFANALRSILRQDPDVIMIGEMRDYEAATIAMQASLTGHLVLSTVHTNSSVATVTRMRNLGIPSYLIASSIIGIIAQRLVRVICPDCKTRDDPDREKLNKLKISDKEKKDVKFYRGKGCSSCGLTGFRGRKGIYEILPFTQKVRELTANDASEANIMQVAVAEGMQTLTQTSIDKALKGITSVDEVVKAIQMEDESGSICAECSAFLGPEFVACPQCGKKVIDTCPSCKKTVDAVWRFCPYCKHDFLESIPIRQTSP